MTPCILLYHFRDKARLTALQKALSPLPLNLRHIRREDYQKPVGYLAGVKGVLPLGKDYDGPELPADMLILCSLPEALIDKTLNALRKSGLSGLGYKAVLTPTNQYWNGLTLFQELKKEHELMHPSGDV